MKLAASLHYELKKIIPGKIARYNDDFEPRAFGDNFIKWKTRSLLIESGTWKNDPDKEYLRMINFISLLVCFLSIADKNYNNFTTENYLSIPENKEIIFDVLLKNLTIEKNKKRYKVDIGINRKETFDPGMQKFVYEGKIVNLGDLSTFYGHITLNLRGMVTKPGKLYPKIFETITSLESINLNKLLHKGYTTVKVKKPVNGAKTVDFPINVTYSTMKKSEIKIDENAGFRIEKEGKIRYVVVNGFLYNVKNGENGIKNGFIIR
jgi:hypothetical protein